MAKTLLLPDLRSTGRLPNGCKTLEARGNVTVTSLKTKVSTPVWRECVAFYRRVFGMVVAEQWEEPDDQGAILAFADGRDEAYLELYLSDRTYDLSGISLQFKVPDLQAFIQSLPDGLAYEGPTRRPWGSTYAYLRDPAGVLVIVYAGGL